MPFALDASPSPEELSSAVNYILSNLVQSSSTNVVTGQINDSTGRVQSYLYKYLYVKYADSFDGSVNFTNTPTNRQYYGLRNNDNSVESTNPTDYIWTKVTGGFGTTKLLYYSVTGGRRIDIVVGLSAPSILYQADSGTAINLDLISGSDGASSRICYAKSTSTSLSSIPSTYQTSGNLSFPPTNTWSGSETWQASPPSLAVNEALFQSDGIYNPTSDLTTWNSPYLSTLKVGQLSAISANLGTITAGDLSIGSSPALSGTTMTGTGGHIYSSGNFAFGNPTTNMVFNGSSVYLNGFTNASTSSSNQTNIAAETTLITFSLAKANTIIAMSSGYFYNNGFGGTGSASYLVEITFRVKNTGTSVTYYSQAVQIFNPLVIASPTGAGTEIPLSFSTPLSLPAGNYITTVQVTSGVICFNSAGTAVAGFAPAYSSTSSVYQANI